MRFIRLVIKHPGRAVNDIICVILYQESAKLSGTNQLSFEIDKFCVSLLAYKTFENVYKENGYGFCYIW